MGDERRGRSRTPWATYEAGRATPLASTTKRPFAAPLKVGTVWVIGMAFLILLVLVTWVLARTSDGPSGAASAARPEVPADTVMCSARVTSECAVRASKLIRQPVAWLRDGAGLRGAGLYVTERPRSAVMEAVGSGGVIVVHSAYTGPEMGLGRGELRRGGQVLHRLEGGSGASAGWRALRWERRGTVYLIEGFGPRPGDRPPSFADLTRQYDRIRYARPITRTKP